MDILFRIAAALMLCLPISGVQLPPDMSQGIFCESCIAVMKELDKILTKKSSDPRELQVVEAMEDICQSKYFSSYDYSPPTTVKACRFLIEKYEEDIEELLTRKVKDSEQEVCHKLTKACEGVDRTKKDKEPIDYRFNNEKQEVHTQAPPKEDDGIQRMNVDINDPGAAERLAEQIKSQLGQQAMGGGEMMRMKMKKRRRRRRRRRKVLERKMVPEKEMIHNLLKRKLNCRVA
ncbi:hypothetical protein OS493_010609 [Desmophyllum pertusum]|uniref:Saposin B-type domain-containing protein n=1 Tax=Desmophyllum pertusum TaxID=174260 RepID=A0A9W9ZRL6_9CNID|nr:hypothetical protein OS493_010609 [Desmophyllum pertusum]